MTDAEIVQACGDKVMGWKRGILFMRSVLDPQLPRSKDEKAIVETDAEYRVIHNATEREFRERGLFFSPYNCKILRRGWQINGRVCKFDPLASDSDACMVQEKSRIGVMPWTNDTWIAFRPDMEGAWRGLSNSPGDRMYDGALGCNVVDIDRRRAIVFAALKTVGIECS